MNQSFTKIFNREKPIIGMIHLQPTLGFEGYVNLDQITKSALLDAESLIAGGVDALIIENNYDTPHTELASEGANSILSIVCDKIRNMTSLPLGICTLWNDYKVSLSIAKICKLQFVRIPVFVNSVETSYGKIFACPEKIIDFQKSIQAQDIAIFNDIHVKHSTLISRLNLLDSAILSKKFGSSAVIITGKWTADSPLIEDLQTVKKWGGLPVLVGSGANLENKTDLINHSDGLIVGTYFKSGENTNKEINIKSYEERIDAKKVREFMDL